MTIKTFGPWALAQLGPYYNPFQEPSVRDYFEPLRHHYGEPRSGETYNIEKAIRNNKIPKLQNPTFDQVEQLTLHGQPFLVTTKSSTGNSNSNWSFQNFTCADFQRKWPTGDARNEFDHKTRVTIGDEKWHRYPESTFKKSPELHMAEGKSTSSAIVWHVKDETPKWMKKEMQNHFITPSWVNANAANKYEVLDSFELWLSPKGGTSVLAHADTYCEPTASLQIRGKKRWRLMMYPKGNSLSQRFDSHDEGIYSTSDDESDSIVKSEHLNELSSTFNNSQISAAEYRNNLHHKSLWKPEYEFDVLPGEFFVFSPNYVHETWMQDNMIFQDLDSQKNQDMKINYNEKNSTNFNTVTLHLKAESDIERQALNRAAEKKLQPQKLSGVPINSYSKAQSTNIALDNRPLDTESRNTDTNIDVIELTTDDGNHKFKRRIMNNKSKDDIQQLNVNSMQSSEDIRQDDEKCGIAATFQYLLPAPTRYYRAFFPRHMNSYLGFFERCQDRLQEHVFFGLFNRKGYNFRKKFPSIKSHVWEKQTEKIMRLIDREPKDGIINHAELLKYLSIGGKKPGHFFAESAALAHMAHQDESQTVTNVLSTSLDHSILTTRTNTLKIRVKEIFGWHDVDGDEKITSEEVFRSISQFHILNHRAIRMTQLIEQKMAKAKTQSDANGYRMLQKFEPQWKIIDDQIYGSFHKTGIRTPEQFTRNLKEQSNLRESLTNENLKPEL